MKASPNVENNKHKESSDGEEEFFNNFHLLNAVLINRLYYLFYTFCQEENPRQGIFFFFRLYALLFRPMTHHVSVQNDTIGFSAPYNGYGATVRILMMIA